MFRKSWLPALADVRTFQVTFRFHCESAVSIGAREPLSQLGHRIRALRQMKSLTQAKPAEKAGLHYVTVGRIENGRENVTMVTLSRIADVLGVVAGTLVPLGEKPVTEFRLSGEGNDSGILRELGRCISGLRDRRGWSQRKLAMMSGLHYVTICRIEKGQRNITLRGLFRLACALSVDCVLVLASGDSQ